jgi:hypothetical protein
MKKTLFFLLFCGLGFCAGYLAGIPFSKTSASIVSGMQGNPENVENLGHKAIPLTPQKDTPEAKRPAKVSQKPQPTKSRNSRSLRFKPACSRWMEWWCRQTPRRWSNFW